MGQAQRSMVVRQMYVTPLRNTILGNPYQKRAADLFNVANASLSIRPQ